MMNGTFKIIGGVPLKGDVDPIPNKNSLMGALPLAVIAPQGVSFFDLPKTSDVESFLEIYRLWGARIETEGQSYTRIVTEPVKSTEVNYEIGHKFRGVFSLSGPLLARFGKASVPIPGGCKLGIRSLSTHLNAFMDLGIVVEESGGYLVLKKTSRTAASGRIWLMEASVTATLNIAMYASANEGDIELIDASCEPHVCDVLMTLKTMGAEINGIGTNRLQIHGTRDLKQTTFAASPDFVDISGYCVAAAITRGVIRIRGANRPEIMNGIIKWMTLFGIDIKPEKDDLIASAGKELRIKADEFPLAGKDLPKFVVRPWPGFPVDVLPVMVTLATKTEGSMLFQNWMYESGFDFIRELNYLGAEIFMSDPQKIIVMDPIITYTGGEVAAPGIIQGTKAIFLAALADKVETIIHGTDILRRRYPDIFNTYRKLGAGIERLGGADEN